MKRKMNDLKEELKKKKPFYGSRVAIKRIISNKTKKVYLSSNCADKDRIISLARLNKVEVIELKETNKDLSNICKKPFFIGAVSFE